VSVTEQEQSEFRSEVSAWMKDNRPADPGFLLPQSFMEVGSDQQLDFPTIFASAKNGWAAAEPDGPQENMAAVFEQILSHVPEPEIIGAMSVLTVLLFWRHRSNIRNLVSGEEGKISFGNKDKE